MLSANLWDEYYKVRRFTTLSKNEQNRIIALLLTKEAAQSYYADTIIDMLGGHIDDKMFLNIAFNFWRNANPHSMRTIFAYSIFERTLKLEPNKAKDVVANAKSPVLNKLVLLCENLTVEEEVKGLRALAKSKYVLSKLHERKYKPRLKALEKLPPVMRLDTVEALLNSTVLKYNIFEDMSEDEFKALLFTSSLRHTGRVSAACNKYNELKYMGIESSVKISSSCNTCGDYSIVITSKVIRTKTGLNSTGLGRVIDKTYCPFCYGSLKQDPSFEEIKK